MFRLDRHIIQTLLPQNCPSLAGKPKLIFVQACQGSETDDGAMVAAKRIEKGKISLTFLIMLDFLVMFLRALVLYQYAYNK